MSLTEAGQPIQEALEQQVACQLQGYFQSRLAAYPHALWRDLEILEDESSTPRQKVAARLTKIEKSILTNCLETVAKAAPCNGEMGRGGGGVLLFFPPGGRDTRGPGGGGEGGAFSCCYFAWGGDQGSVFCFFPWGLGGSGGGGGEAEFSWGRRGGGG